MKNYAYIIVVLIVSHTVLGMFASRQNYNIAHNERKEYQNLVNQISTKCSPDSLHRTSKMPSNALQYLQSSHELHLSMDYIVNLPQDKIQECSNLILEVEENSLIDNIWFHVKNTDIHKKDNFAELTKEWYDDFHFFVFSFSDDAWNSEIFNSKKNSWSPLRKLMGRDSNDAGPVKSFMDALRFTELEGEKLKWAAFEFPRIEGVRNLQENGLELIWAIPHYRMHAFLEFRHGNLLIPFNPLVIRSDYLKFVSDRTSFKPTFGSRQMANNHNLFYKLVETIKEKFGEKKSFAVAFPRNVLGLDTSDYNENGFGLSLNPLHPPNEVMDKLFELCDFCDKASDLAGGFVYDKKFKKYTSTMMMAFGTRIPYRYGDIWSVSFSAF